MIGTIVIIIIDTTPKKEHQCVFVIHFAQNSRWEYDMENEWAGTTLVTEGFGKHSFINKWY